MKWIALMLLVIGCAPMDRSVVTYRASTVGVGEISASVPVLQMPYSMNALMVEVGSDLDDAVIVMVGVAYQDDNDRGAFAIKYGKNMSRFGDYSRIDLELMSFHRRAIASAGISGVERPKDDFSLEIDLTFGVGISF